MTFVRDRHRDRIGGRRSFQWPFYGISSIYGGVLAGREVLRSALEVQDFHTEACIGKGMEGNVSIFLGYAIRSYMYDYTKPLKQCIPRYKLGQSSIKISSHQ